MTAAALRRKLEESIRRIEGLKRTLNSEVARRKRIERELKQLTLDASRQLNLFESPHA